MTKLTLPAYINQTGFYQLAVGGPNDTYLFRPTDDETLNDDAPTVYAKGGALEIEAVDPPGINVVFGEPPSYGRDVATMTDAELRQEAEDCIDVRSGQMNMARYHALTGERRRRSLIEEARAEQDTLQSLVGQTITGAGLTDGRLRLALSDGRTIDVTGSEDQFGDGEVWIDEVTP